MHYRVNSCAMVVSVTIWMFMIYIKGMRSRQPEITDSLRSI